MYMLALQVYTAMMKVVHPVVYVDPAGLHSGNVHDVSIGPADRRADVFADLPSGDRCMKARVHRVHVLLCRPEYYEHPSRSRPVDW